MSIFIKQYWFIAALLIVVFLLIMFVAVPSVFAQGESDIGDPNDTLGGNALVHCGRQGSTSACGICDLLVLIQRISNFIFFVLVPGIAMLLFLYAGFLIMLGGADTTKVSTGISIFKTTVIGIVIMFTAWMITTFVLNTLAKDSDISDSFFTITCIETNTQFVDGLLLPSDIEDDEIRDELLREGVIVKGRCSATVRENCVNLDGMQQGTIDEIIRINNECRRPNGALCGIVITGGTENIAHTCNANSSSHCSGHKVDFRSHENGELNDLSNFIISNYREVDCETNLNSRCQRQFVAPGGARYFLEGNHWDVLVL